MKKRNLQSLHLNKRTISNFKHKSIHGGLASDRLDSGCTCGSPLPSKECQFTKDCTNGQICSSAICILESKDMIICILTN